MSTALSARGGCDPGERSSAPTPVAHVRAARALAAHFATSCVLEYGREHWEAKVAGLPMPGAGPMAGEEASPLPGWTDDEFLHIADHVPDVGAEQLPRHLESVDPTGQERALVVDGDDPPGTEHEGAADVAELMKLVPKDYQP